MGQRAVIYTRVSKDDTGEGKSNERQAADCRKLAELRGWDVVDEQADISISAYTGALRPSWQRVIQMAQAGEVDIILAWHLDRITRSMIELEALINLAQETGVAIVTVSGDIDLTSDVGRMVARILAAVARAEVERKSERMKLANKQRAGAGEMWKGGSRPLGYNEDRETINKAEAKIIRKAAEDFLAGKPVVTIRQEWEELGVVVPGPGRGTGTPYSLAGINKLLRNPLYAGMREYQGQLYKGEWEPILDEYTHLAIEAKYKSRTQTERGRPRISLLSKVAACSECGELVTADWQRNKALYRCPSGHVQTLRDQADELVSAFVVAYLEKPQVAQHLVPATGPDVSELALEADRLRLRLEELSDALDDDALTMDQFVDLNTRTIRKIEEVETEIVRLGTNGAIGDIVVGAEDLAEQWLNADLKMKRDIVAALFDVTIHPANRRKNVPIEERLTVAVKK